MRTTLLVALMAFFCIAGFAVSVSGDGTPYYCTAAYNGCYVVTGATCFENAGTCENGFGNYLDFDGFKNVNSIVGQCNFGYGTSCTPGAKTTCCETSFYSANDMGTCGTLVCYMVNDCNACPNPH